MAHTVGSPPPQPTLSDLLRIEQEQQQHGSAYTLAAGSSTNVASEKQYLVSVTMVVFVSTLLAGVLIMRHGERIRVIALGLRSLNASSPATKPVDARTSRRRRPAGSRPIGSRAPERDSDLEAPQELETETEDDDEYPPPSSRSEGVVPSSATRSRPLPPKTSNARHDRSSQQQKQQQEEQRQGQQRRQRQQQQHQQQPARGALSRSRLPQDVNRVPTASCRSGRTQGARSLQPHVIQHARFAPPDRCSGGRSAGGHECAKDLHGVFWQTPIAAVSVYAYAEEVTEGTAPCTKPLRKPQVWVPPTHSIREAGRVAAHSPRAVQTLIFRYALTVSRAPTPCAAPIHSEAAPAAWLSTALSTAADARLHSGRAALSSSRARGVRRRRGAAFVG